MAYIALVVEAEPWTSGNLGGALLLVSLVTIVAIWVARRARRR